MPYDPIKDFTPIARVGSFPSFIAVNPDLPVKSMAELVAYAKANPGKISAGYGNSTGRITVETIKRRLNLDIVPVAYRSNPAAVTDLMAGHVQMGVPDFSHRTADAEGRENPSARGADQRARPDLAGRSDLGRDRDAGLRPAGLDRHIRPGGMPQDVVDTLAKPIEKALASPEVRDRFRDAGVEIYWIGPAGFSDYVKTELVKWTDADQVGGHRAGMNGCR